MKNLPLFIIALLFIAVILIPKAVVAEIATTKDWIGLFSQDSNKNCVANDTKETCRSNTVNGTSWAYTNNCTQIADNTAPKLSNPSGCSFATPPNGTYEYRMYAYDQGNPEALIAKSKPIIVGDTPPAPGGGTGLPCPEQNSYPRVQNGLISAPSNTGNFGNLSGTCVIDNQAAFVPYKIPSYEDLKSMYYTQAKTITGIVTKELIITDDPANKTHVRLDTPPDHLYYVTGNLGIDGNIPGGQSGVIFVDQDLTISGNIITPPGLSDTGLVFVVGEDVNISQSVEQIDAVIIAKGTICTAYNGTTCLDGITETPRLIINGSLIALEETKPVLFRRFLADNSCQDCSAEKINNEPKYLVILRDLMSDTLQKWSEIQ